MSIEFSDKVKQQVGLIREAILDEALNDPRFVDGVNKLEKLAKPNPYQFAPETVRDLFFLTNLTSVARLGISTEQFCQLVNSGVMTIDQPRQKFQAGEIPNELKTSVQIALNEWDNENS